MKAKAAVTFLAVAALLVFALPADAAKPQTYHQRASITAAIAGNGTHGFDLFLLSFDRGVVIALSKVTGEGDQSVSYVAIHRLRPTDLEQGDLDLKVGKLGHFRGHLVATSTKVRKPERGCTGDPTTEESGYFSGSFVFHGERGYTTVDTARLPGSIIRQGATDCRVSATEPGSHPKNSKRAEEMAEKAAEEDEFRLVASDRKAHLVLQASREQVPPGPEGKGTTTFAVSYRDGKVGGFQITRRASVFDNRSDAQATFLTPNLAEPLAEATLAPPAPFSGSATFQLEGPKTASWTGDLTAELPGLGEVPLTGTKIYAGLCKGRSDCTHTLPDPLGEPLEADTSGLVAVSVGSGGS